MCSLLTELRCLKLINKPNKANKSTMNNKNINSYICLASCFCAVGIILLCCFVPQGSTHSNVSTRYCALVSDLPSYAGVNTIQQIILILPNNKTIVMRSSFCRVIPTSECESGKAIWVNDISLNYYESSDLICSSPPIDLVITGTVFILVFLVMMVILFLHPHCRNKEPRVFPVIPAIPGVLAESV